MKAFPQERLLFSVITVAYVKLTDETRQYRCRCFEVEQCWSSQMVLSAETLDSVCVEQINVKCKEF